MNYTIKGLTDSTISINSLGVVVRGNSENIEKYPHSVVKNITVTNEQQMGELQYLVNHGLISIESSGEKSKGNKKLAKLLQNNKMKVKPIRGKETEETENVTIMNPDGHPVSLKMSKAISIGESILTKASIDAAIEIDNAESQQESVPFIDPFDESDRDGSNVVISKGRKVIRSKMKKSHVEPVDIEDSKFIDGSDKYDNNESAFIDKGEVPSTDAFIDNKDNFIE